MTAAKHMTLWLCVLLAWAVAGCARTTGPTTRATINTDGLTPPHRVPTVDAVVAPPVGWTAEPLKSSTRHTHQLWISPTRKTAYGVISIPLPLPVGTDLFFPIFMMEMRRSEGEARLLSREYDEHLRAVRFEADGKLYRIRSNLIVRGTQAWAVYAGTVRAQPVDDAELSLAVRAREHTVVGAKPAVSGP